MLMNFLIVGLGGAIGSMLRHSVGLLSLKFGLINFPWGTFGINIFGSLCIGIMAGILAQTTNAPQEIRLFIVVGILGGFTTFSAFSLDTILLMERGQYLQAFLYVGGSVLLSFAATFLGLMIMRATTA